MGDRFEVSRIPEELEFAPGLLTFLEQSHLVPGARGEVTSASPDGTRTVEVDGQHVGIGTFASTRILVTTTDLTSVGTSRRYSWRASGRSAAWTMARRLVARVRAT